MARKEVNIFSSESINKIQNALEELTDYMSSPKTIQELTDLAYELVIDNVSKYSDNHVKNIVEEVSGDVGKVYTNDDVLIFNEYGTGIVGSQNPHPETDGWKYDVNSHGDLGWWYQENGEWHWTKGLPSGQGFYRARETLKTLAKDKINLTIEKIFDYEK